VRQNCRARGLMDLDVARKSQDRSSELKRGDCLMLLHITHPSSAAPANITSWLLLSLSLTALIQSCAMLSPPKIRPAVDVTGMWQGSSFGACMARLPRCGAVVLISLSMIQDESKITGFYRCATGNTICRNLNTEGNIAVGTISGSSVSLRVMFEDVSSCLFNGTFSTESGSGSYICMQGGGMVERGHWKVRREA
jgi:hypothetical protein